MNECVMLCHCNVVVRGACMLMRTRSARIVQKTEKNQEKPHNHRETTETDQHHSTTTATIMTITTHALPLFEVEIPVGNDPARRGAKKKKTKKNHAKKTVCQKDATQVHLSLPVSNIRRLPSCEKKPNKKQHKQTNKHKQNTHIHIYTYTSKPRNLL